MITRILQNSWVQLALRLTLGGIFIYSGVAKLIDPQLFADSIANFRMLPTQVINLFALGLPFLEIALGGMLVLGRLERMAALGILLLCATFALALLSALLRGIVVDCGCFGSGSASVYEERLSLGRDLALGSFALLIYTVQSGRILSSLRTDGAARTETSPPLICTVSASRPRILDMHLLHKD